MENPNALVEFVKESIIERIYDAVVRHSYMTCAELKMEIDRVFPEGQVIQGIHYTRGVLRNLTKKDMIRHLVGRFGMIRNDDTIIYLNRCVSRINGKKQIPRPE